MSPRYTELQHAVAFREVPFDVKHNELERGTKLRRRIGGVVAVLTPEIVKSANRTVDLLFELELAYAGDKEAQKEPEREVDSAEGLSDEEEEEEPEKMQSHPVAAETSRVMRAALSSYVDLTATLRQRESFDNEAWTFNNTLVNFHNKPQSPRRVGMSAVIRIMRHAIYSFQLDLVFWPDKPLPTVEARLPYLYSSTSVPPAPFTNPLDILPSIASQPHDLALSCPSTNPSTPSPVLYTTSRHLSAFSSELADFLHDGLKGAASRAELRQLSDIEVEDESDVELEADDGGEVVAGQGQDGVGEAGEPQNPASPEGAADAVDGPVAEGDALDTGETDAGAGRRSSKEKGKRRRSSASASSASAQRRRLSSTAAPADPLFRRGTTPSPPLVKEEAGRAASAAATLASPHRHILIPHCSSLTFEAVLAWTYSKLIVFAPLRSIDAVKHDDYVRKYKQEHPTRPQPVSARSVFRLAERLGLVDLEKLALEELKRQFTPGFAADHALDLDVRTFPTYKDIIFDYIVDNRKSVREKKAWKDLDPAQVEGGFALYGELMARVKAAKEKASGGYSYSREYDL